MSKPKSVTKTCVVSKLKFEHIDNLQLNLFHAGNMTSRDALVAAYNALPDGPERIVIAAMIQQQGCEEHDASCRDGRLTSLCDVIMFG